jgi:hypothetical protein
MIMAALNRPQQPRKPLCGAMILLDSGPGLDPATKPDLISGFLKEIGSDGCL